MTEAKTARVAIIGGGPVGTLNAIYFSQRGWIVDVYEQRSDIRLSENKNNRRGRSINLSLSDRGISALRATGLDLEKTIMESSVPMHARMLHLGSQGYQIPQPYSIYGDHTNSVDRTHFNELMLDASEKCPNVTIYFEHHLSQVNFDVGSMEFLQGPNKTKVIKYANLIIGADGAYSKLRGQMMRTMRMNYQQEYINTGYCELHMPPIMIDGKPTYALDPNHLHVWPRHSFLVTAIPDLTHTFTCTLFLPFEVFDTIDDKEKLIRFFDTHFKDLLPLIGADQLEHDYFNNPRGSLISIKASPHHLSDKGVIVGDAAHAMVPFFGQGLNCGLEDIEILHQILDQHHIKPLLSPQGIVSGLEQALTAYSNERVKDTQAICDLAMYNHYELRSAVTSVRFLAVKKLEQWIHYYFPHLIIPLYSMVSFSSLPYSQVVKRWRAQAFWLNLFIGSVAFTMIPVSAWLVYSYTPPAVVNVGTTIVDTCVSPFITIGSHIYSFFVSIMSYQQ